MTTIASDGITVACDGRVSRRGTVLSNTFQKMRRLADGRIIAVSGWIDSMNAATEWFNGRRDKPPKLESNTTILVVGYKSATIYEENMLAQPCELPVAIGSGMDLALGAMLAGATPRQAVEIACTRDTASGGTITEMETRP